MPREESTADDFPDKGDFLTPSAKRKKPDCDRKTLIPDPCDLRVDRRKKTDGNNDCAVAPIVQVCPEDLGKFKIPELPVVPTVFMPKRSEPITLAPLKVIPAPELECNDSFTLSCPSEGWLDADWARENLGESSGASGEGYEIIEDQFGGVSNLKELNLDYDQLPDDPDIFIAPEDDEKEFGRKVIVTSCSFVAATKKEANKKARINAIRSLDCQFCNPELVVNCLDHQEMALGIGGEGYTAENTYIEITGDGSGAAAEVVIEEGTGRVTGINVTSGGDKYTAILAEIIGDGIGAAIGKATLEDEDGCGGPLISMSLGQVFPDPAYNPEVDPPIYSTQKGVCVPQCTTTSRESVAAARDEALAEALRSLDCSYQSPELHKDCPEGEVPRTGFDMPLGAFKTPITRGTQLEVTESSQEIIDALTCIQIPCPDGFPEAIVDIQINDPNESCDDNGGGQNGSWFDASFDEANCEYKLEGVLELPEIPCACGFETTTSINGMTVISGSNVETNSNSECVGSLDIGIDVIGNTECELIFNLETCEFDLAIDLPDLKMKCEEISMGVSGGDFKATVIPSDTFGVDVTANGNGCVSGDGCSLDLELPSYELTINVPDINVPCPDGFNTETQISIQGGEVCIGSDCDTANGSFDIDFDINTCQFTGVMELDLPDINIPCGEFETSVAISGGNFTGPEPEEPGGGGGECSASLDIAPTIETSGNASADFTISNCGFELDITLPDISMEVPCQTISASASGGTVDASIVTGTDFGVSVTTSPEEPCVSGDGCDISIDIPSTTIEITVPDIDIPEIPCPEGFTTSSSVNISGGVIEVTEDGNTTTVGGNPEANVNLKIDMNTCQIIQTMEITLPNADIDIPSFECANGYSASGSLGVSGGDVTAGNNVTVSNSTSASGNATLTSSNCGIELSGDIVLPSYQIDVDIPAMTCANGYSASGNIGVSGGSVSGGNNITVSGGNGGASSNVSFSQSQCAMEISGSIILPDLTIDVDLPTIECANGYSVSGSPSVTGGSISGGNNVTVSGGNSGASGNLSLSGSGCNITLDGDITLPDVTIDVDLPNIECANGYSVDGSASISGGTISAGNNVTVSGGNGGASGNVSLTGSGCNITMDGDFTLPDVTIDVDLPACAANGYTFSGSATVSGGSVSGGTGITVSGGNSGASGNVTISESSCGVTLDGTITLPDITITADAVSCANGISGDGSAQVSGGSISAGSGISVSGGNSGASGNVSLSGSGCNLTLSGEISLPDVTITADDIDCANVSGAMCESDYSETTLEVCDSSGSTTSITVLVKN